MVEGSKKKIGEEPFSSGSVTSSGTDSDESSDEDLAVDSAESGVIVDMNKGEGEEKIVVEFQTHEKKRQRCLTKKGWIKLILLLVVVGVVIAAFPALRVHKRFPALLEWIRHHKCQGFFIFVVVYSLATVLFVPGVILALGGGFVFGLPLGLLAVWIGGTIGQTAAFLLGRFLFRKTISTRTRQFKFWRAIEKVTDDQGWKIVALLRLAPVIPYDALNYAFGLTAIGFWKYFFSSTVFIVPGSLAFVYFGSLADCIADVASGKPDVDSKTLIITAVASGVAIIAVVLLTTYYARRALVKIIGEDEEPPPSPEANPRGRHGLDLGRDSVLRMECVVADSSCEDLV